MSTVNEKMTALADEIRELSGTTTTKSIDTMTSDVNTANAEITEQTDLIAQIATALEGKAGGSGGGESGEGIETCSVHITCSSGYITDCAYTAYENDSQVPKIFFAVPNGTQDAIFNNIICGTSIFVVISGLALIGNTCSGGVEFVSLGSHPTYRLFKAPTAAGSTGYINIYNSD